MVREISSGQVLYRCELALPMLRRALEYAEPRGWHVNAYLDEEVYTERASPEADLYARVSMVPYHVVGPLSRWLNRESTKLVLVDLDPQEVPGRMAELDYDLLRDHLLEAWEMCVPKKVAKAYLSPES